MSDKGHVTIIQHTELTNNEEGTLGSDISRSTCSTLISPFLTPLSPVSPAWNTEVSPALPTYSSLDQISDLPTPPEKNIYQEREASPHRHGAYPEVVEDTTAKEKYLVPPHQPGLLVRDDSHGDKETYVATTPVEPDSLHKVETQDHEPQRRRNICGFSRRMCLIPILIVILFVVGLGAGLGAGLHKSKASHRAEEGINTTTLIGGTIRPEYYSTKGAFNGSGIAIASANFGDDASMFVFYQKYNGDIEQLIYHADGTWDFVTTVAVNAKNATALSTVAYIVDSVATWHLFYFDQDQVLKQRISSNASVFQTNIWRDGPLNKLNLTGNNAVLLGMQACYWGNYYGSDTSWFEGWDPSRSTAKLGMNLWFGVNATTFEQYDWTIGEDQWIHSRTWPDLNTNAGVGCQSWMTNTTTYAMFVDTTNTLKIYWRDTDNNKSSTSTHPINEWVDTHVDIPGVYPASAIGYTDFMAFQANDTVFHIANISWAAEHTSIVSIKDSEASDGMGIQRVDTAIPGSHMSFTGQDDASGGRSAIILYQKEGNDIHFGRRDYVQGGWTFTDVPLDSIQS